MKSLYFQIRSRFAKALQKIVPEKGELDPLLREAGDPKFGDYQSNIAMSLAKELKKNPREVAQLIIDTVDLFPLCARPEIAGPGFINIRLEATAVTAHLQAMREDERLGIDKAVLPIKHVMDFSSPNLAKEMHVGHLRTTITGESIARIIEFLGHEVERVNHVGDWGTQFGMLLEFIYRNHPEVLQNPEKFRVADLEGFYKQAKTLFDNEPGFADAARQKVVLLQSGDATALKVWKAFVAESLRYCHAIYAELGVTLKDVGESFYNDRLEAVVKELVDKKIAVDDGGAMCVFLDGFKNREGEPLPFIIRKTDGGYNYASTDLAAMKYRVLERGAKRVIIITDIRQAQHFEMLFATSRMAGWVSDAIRLDHIGYGMILGADKKPFRTRDGGTVRLKDLMEESITRCREVIRTNALNSGRTFTPEEELDTARKVGLAAIKYFDLSHNLASDYVFSWDHMLAMDGNTGPYMLYAYARIRSIGRKANIDFETLKKDIPLSLDHPAELKLAKMLMRFGDVVDDVARELKPNLLTDYLYHVSKAFSAFYDRKHGVSVLDAETPVLKESRLALCDLTARVLKRGLSLLSIETVEAM